MKTKTKASTDKRTKAELLEQLEQVSKLREGIEGELRALRERYSKIHLALHQNEARHVEQTVNMLRGFACGIGVDLDPDCGCQIETAALVLPDYDCTRPGSTIVVVSADGNVYEATVTGVK